MHYLPEGTLIKQSNNKEHLISLAAMEKTCEEQAIVEAVPYLCDRDFTLHFDIGGVHGVMPRGEVQFSSSGEETKDIAVLTRVGKPTCFKITGFCAGEKGEKVAFLSRKEAQRECRDVFISTLIPGDIVEATVTHIEPFGAFADVGCGIVALLPINAISVSRISHPQDRLYQGERIYAIIKQLDSDGRIYVSMRELLGTWEENASLFSPGQTVMGVVRSMESYGVFIELTPNLAGLAEWRGGMTVGASAAVYIKSILPDRMKIKLALVDCGKEIFEPLPLRYYLPQGKTHIDEWIYSPPGCKKTVTTQFT